jgi:hypothetical protein
VSFALLLELDTLAAVLLDEELVFDWTVELELDDVTLAAVLLDEEDWLDWLL